MHLGFYKYFSGAGWPVLRAIPNPAVWSTSLLTRVVTQLSRGKDSNKSSKKNKEPKDGTASPASSRDSNQSPVQTPSSSTSTLNDIRNKPLPPSNAGFRPGDHNASNQQAPQLPALGVQSSPDRLAGSSATNGQGTPSRHGALPPTVIVSPSPMVGSTFQSFPVAPIPTPPIPFFSPYFL